MPRDNHCISQADVRHCIGSGVIGKWPFVDISAGEYESVKKATSNIRVLLGIEEKFDMVLENYLEYERDLLSLALGHMARHNKTWFSRESAKSLLNRRLANLLTVVRMYIEQAKQDSNKLCRDSSDLKSRICQAFSKQYDHSFGYRVMEATRNSLQHSSLPISGVLCRLEREDRKNEVAS